MRVSKKTDYALRTVIALATSPKGEAIPVHVIAERQNIPDNFLEQILLVLKGAGLVASRRGKHGGYYLAVAPDQITLAQVVKLTEGTLAPAACVDVNPSCSCPGLDRCPVREVWLDILAYITDKLEGITVQDMCMRARQLAGTDTLNYTI